MTAPVTTQDFADYLPQVTVDASNLAQVQDIIDRAWSMVVTFLGYEYAAYPGSATALVVSSVGGTLLYLPPHLAASITSVVDPAGGTLDTTYYAENANGNLYTTATNYPYGYQRHGYGWWPPGRYVVTAKWGYGPAPDAVSQVTLELAVNIWRGRDRGMWTDVIGTDIIGSASNGALRFTGGLTNQQRAVLTAVKRNLHGGRVVV